MAAPLVSVVIPNFNHAAFLRERIRSVLGQTVADLEVILLDDASTDDSVLVMRAFTSDTRVTHVVVNEVNSGSPFHQWRKGMALARGTWVWIAESYDSSVPVTHFCYPYGEFRAEHPAMTENAGFATATTTRRGRVARGTDILRLPRVPVLRTTSLVTFWLKLATTYEDRRAA